MTEEKVKKGKGLLAIAKLDRRISEVQEEFDEL